MRSCPQGWLQAPPVPPGGVVCGLPVRRPTRGELSRSSSHEMTSPLNTPNSRQPPPLALHTARYGSFLSLKLHSGLGRGMERGHCCGAADSRSL